MGGARLRRGVRGPRDRPVRRPRPLRVCSPARAAAPALLLLLPRPRHGLARSDVGVARNEARPPPLQLRRGGPSCAAARRLGERAAGAAEHSRRGRQRRGPRAAQAAQPPLLYGPRPRRLPARSGPAAAVPPDGPSDGPAVHRPPLRAAAVACRPPLRAVSRCVGGGGPDADERVARRPLAHVCPHHRRKALERRRGAGTARPAPAASLGTALPLAEDRAPPPPARRRADRLPPPARPAAPRRHAARRDASPRGLARPPGADRRCRLALPLPRRASRRGGGDGASLQRGGPPRRRLSAAARGRLRARPRRGGARLCAERRRPLPAPVLRGGCRRHRAIATTAGGEGRTRAASVGGLAACVDSCLRRRLRLHRVLRLRATTTAPRPRGQPRRRGWVWAIRHKLAQAGAQPPRLRHLPCRPNHVPADAAVGGGGARQGERHRSPQRGRGGRRRGRCDSRRLHRNDRFPGRERVPRLSAALAPREGGVDGARPPPLGRVVCVHPRPRAASAASMALFVRARGGDLDRVLLPRRRHPP
mmetsp:Transcript_43528/g.141735  ORF Transcript_43528/g.141735 Transcript_43528/m.141735 type:complete len:534 (+) Transcript_43528:169-1770(+)